MWSSIICFTYVFLAATAAPVSTTSNGLNPDSIFLESEIVGGAAGLNFTDLPILQGARKPPTITSMAIKGAEHLDSVELVGSTDGAADLYHVFHGGDGGARQTLDLATDEVINRIELEYNYYETCTSSELLIFWLKATSNRGQSIETGTRSDGSRTGVFEPPKGYTQLVGFLGKSADTVNALGFIWA